MACIVLLAALLAGCGEQKEAAKAPEAPPPAVTVATVSSKDVSPTYDFLGRVVAVDTVDLRARVEGFLEKRLFNEGQMVKVGDLLFTIEKDQFQAKLDQAKANVAAAQATLTNAQVQYQRALTLVKNQNIPQATVDQRKADQDTAQAAVLQAQAAQELAEIDLGYTDIRAAVAGKIGLAKLSPGNLVSPASGVLATIVSQDPIYVTFPVSQRQILDIRAAEAGSGATPADAVIHLRLADGSAYPEAGKIDFADNQVSQATDTLTIRAVFPNPEGTLVDGQFATVTAAASKGEASLVVPQAALQIDQAGPYVLVVDDQSKVDVRRIKPGDSTGTETVVLDGLKGGEKVIVDGALKVRPGMTVKASDAPKAAGA
jgi:membrane fusion protein (multidrug efflux system)